MAKSVNRSIRLFVNGEEVEHSLNNVRKSMNELRREINKTERGTDEYVKKSAELRKVTAYYNEMNREIRGMPSMFERLTKSAGGFVTLLIGSFAVSNVIGKFRQLVDLSAELADKQADVRKTTGMSKDEIRALTQELDKLNTRTSRLDLLSIAEEGGRIGIAKEDIAEFTEAMNKANVALGDTFGSAEEVASTLGKLRFLYKETSEMGVSDAYNKIGSALNELGANGVASEQNIAAFATRVGALPNAFKPSIADAMALGAAFEESGVNAEVAGRSYGILIQTAANNTSAFAQQMGITKQELEAMINENPVEFFLKFSESLKGMDSNGVRMAQTLKGLGISADGVNKIIGAAANNNDRFRESIALSNQAMEEGTSLTDEYNVKNENLAATLEKIQKTFVEWIDSDTVQDFVEGLVGWFGMLIGAVNKSDDELTTLQRVLNFAAKAFGVLVASTVSYHAAMRLSILLTNSKTKAVALSTIADKGAAAAQRLYTIAVMSGSVVINTLTGNINRAAAAQRVLNTVTKANPWGLLFSAIMAVASAIYLVYKNTKQATDVQKKFGDAMKAAHEKAVEGLGETISKIDNLVAVIKDENISLETRKKAYEELVRINSIFNGILEDEHFNIGKLNVVYGIYIRQLNDIAKAKATAQLVSDTQTDVTKEAFELNRVERQLAIERERLKTIEQYKTIQRKDMDGVWEEVEVETAAYKNQIKIIRDLEKAQSNQKKTLDEVVAVNKDAQEFNKENLKIIDEQIAQAEKNIEVYSKYSDAMAKTIVENNKRELKHLKERRAILLGGSGFNEDDSGESPDLSGTGKDNEPERRRKIAEELLRIEIQQSRQLRDEKLRSREELAKLMEEGFAKEAELLDIERQKKLNKLQDEQDDLLFLQAEYNRRSLEERSKGNIEGAEAFKKQADELSEIISEKNKTLLFIQQTYENDLQTLKLESYKKQFDEDQKAYERKLQNLETEQNNELKALVDLESAKQVLRNHYGYNEDELKKVKDFEKAKSQIILEQQKETYRLQAEQLQNQIDQLQDSLKFDEAMANSVFGKIFDEEQREQILEWIEELENQLSKLNNPEEEEANAEGQKLMTFIDIFGFSADQWEEAFSNLDTMSGKLALVQMGVQAMTNAWSQFYSIQRQNMQRDLDSFTSASNRKKDELKKQLDEGYISEATYNAKIAKLDAEYEKKRSEMEYKSAMNEWQMGLLQAATNTAIAVTAALKVPPAPNVVLASFAGGLGAIQTGLIAANKPKKPTGYFTGGETSSSGLYDEFGRELADGPVHANEYVIPEWLRRDPQVAQMEAFIEARRKGGNPPTDSVGYADGGETKGATQAVVMNRENFDSSFLEIALALRELKIILEELRRNPIEAKLTRTMETAKFISDDLTDYNNHKNKNRR